MACNEQSRIIKRFFLLIFLAAFLFAVSNVNFFKSGFNYAAGLFSKIFEEKIAPEDLLGKYGKVGVRVLIVPGHDNASVGAVYKNLKETDLNIQLAYEILDFFNADENFDAFITRDKNGDYSDWFVNYFEGEKENIAAFRDYLKSVVSFAKEAGSFDERTAIYHNPAADNVSLRLYAINKLADDHGIDIVLHVHFNDYPRGWQAGSGEYSGFAVYVPESQLPNHRVSMALAELLVSSFEKYFSKSDFPDEADTIVEDQQLIAVGSNASRKGASLLVEYGYIYESQFVNPGPRSAIMKELAAQTYWAIKDYFESNLSKFDFDRFDNLTTTLLPHEWKLSLRRGMNGFADIVYLQAVLLEEGVYPPLGKTLSDCPLNGNFGPCTEEAVKLFQEKHGISPVGLVGPRTLDKLNELYN